MVRWNIFPVPRSITKTGQTIDYSPCSWIQVDPRLSAAFKKQVLRFADRIRKSFGHVLSVTAGDPACGGIFLRITVDAKATKPHGYSLTAKKDGITLNGMDEAGLFYGLATLNQIVEQCGSRFEGFAINDWPDFLNRGFMLDISRCKVPTMETLRYYVDLLADLKVNQFQLYIEHTFAFSKHETVWHHASPMTPSEILDLDAYCRERYIELVPNLNSFGHFERWLRHPELSHLAECPKGCIYPGKKRAEAPWGAVLKPNHDSIAFLDSLYPEYLPNFSSRLFNVGCDETWELGHGWSKPLCDTRGKTQVYLDHLLAIQKLVKKHGHRMMFWGDIILHQPELIKKLPGEVIALNWGYDEFHPFDKEGALFSKSNIPYYVCPGTSSWCSLTGRTRNAIGNCNNAARFGLKHGSIGFLNTDWGDGGHHQYLPTSYVGIAAGAGASWCLSSNEDADLKDALNRIFFHDRSGDTGRLVYELGRVLEYTPERLPNGTIFHAGLFWDEPLRHFKSKVSALHLKKCMTRFAELEASIADCRAATADRATINKELANAIGMARLGTLRLLHLLGEKRVPAENRMRLALRNIIRKHEELWLVRNRPGGLHESSGILHRKLADWKKYMSGARF